MSLIPLIGRIANERLTFRDSRQIRSTSCGPLHGEKPGRDGHSLWPCARGNHACSRGDDCAAEMFFSLLYYLFILLLFRLKIWYYTTFRAAKLHKSFELHKFIAKFFTFHFSLFTFFCTFAPAKEIITLLNSIFYD